MTTSADPSGRCSPTGYEAFLEDSIQSAVKSGTVPEPASEKDPAPSSGTAPSAKTTAAEAESWTTSITTEAQGLITNYFSPEPCPEIPCGDKSVPTGCTDLPQLAASSSSEKSNDEGGKDEKASPAKGIFSSFADKITSTCHVDPERTACQMDTVCAKIEFEKEAPSRPALTEQGELLRIEGPPPSKPWTEELSSKVQDAQRVISSKTHRLFIALGLSTKKEQALMTDFYTTKSAKTLKPKKEAKNKEPARLSRFSVQNLVIAIGLGSKKAESKEKKQTLMTDFDPNKAPMTVPEAETVTSAVTEVKHEPAKSEIPDVPAVPSEATIATEMRTEEKPTKWNLWTEVKKFGSKFKLPETNTPTCEGLAVPKVEVPSLPSFGVFLCNPKVANDESAAKEAKTDDGQVMVEGAKVEGTKVEETKVEETKVEETKVEETKVEKTKVEEAKVETANAEKAMAEETKND